MIGFILIFSLEIKSLIARGEASENCCKKDLDLPSWHRYKPQAGARHIPVGVALKPADPKFA